MMKNINIDEILSPISDENPCGFDLDVIQDQDFNAFQLLSIGEPDKEIRIKNPNGAGEINKVIPGKEPEAKLIIEKALLLLKKSKDLRLVTELSCALVREDGLFGLENGLKILYLFMDKFWDSFYPKLGEDEVNDPIFRINVMKDFLSSKKLIKLVRNSSLIESREIGKFKIIDIEIAQNKLNPIVGRTAVDMSLLELAFQKPDDEDVLKQLYNSLTKSLFYIDSIIQMLIKNSIYLEDEWAKISLLLKQVQALFKKDEQVEPMSLLASAAQNENSKMPNNRLKLSCRSDVSNELKQISEFLKKSEPAHPAPLLIDRAIKLLEMDFLEIIGNLAPDAIDQIYSIGGIEKKSEKT